ncbi:MAG: four-carbon acid sugar kinase family protein [Limisphaerales bacterium]
MIGVIADDLTGAAEIGAVGLRHGLRAEIVLNGKPGGGADLVCVDTESRSQSSEEASVRAASAAKLLRNAGARWIFKKVDSVLRGQVTAEIEAVMKQLKFGRALLAPANPSLGRTIQDGKYFIRGRPIHKTEFARDPEFPRKSSRVLELLKSPQAFSICVGKWNDALPENGMIVGEAATPQDVQEWAAHRNPETLPAGGADFFSALLAADSLAKIPLPFDDFFMDGAREFFVCGTSTLASRKFAAAARRNKMAIFSLPLELAWGAKLTPVVSEAIGQRIVAAFNSHPRVILTIGLPLVREALISQRLSNHVVQIAESALRRANVGHVFAEGGATAAELARRMNWSRLKVLRELAPGVATLAVEGEKNLLLTIKPGSYAWPAKWTWCNLNGCKPIKK